MTATLVRPMVDPSFPGASLRHAVATVAGVISTALASHTAARANARRARDVATALVDLDRNQLRDLGLDSGAM